MARLVIFDLDGTLIDSLLDIEVYINQMLKNYGYKERTYNELRSFIGNGAKNLVKSSIGQDISEELLQERLNFYNINYTNSGSPKTKIYEGIKEVLITLKNKGFKIAVLTNKPQETTDKIVEKYFDFVKFDAVIGSTSTRKRKPDKEETLKLMQKFNISNEDVYFVGDGETDFLTAQNARVKSISVLWGYRDKDFLQSFGAKIFVNEPLELLNLIR